MSYSNKMEKEIKKQFKEIRKYMEKQMRHLGQHCCFVDGEGYNKILQILYDLEKKHGKRI